MDEQLNQAPCGYVSLADDNTILTINETLLDILGYDRQLLLGQRFDSILTTSSRMFYQIYFFPLIRLSGKVEEMYISMRSVTNVELPVLLNASRRERGGEFVNECILLPMRRRMDYEEQLNAAEKAANKAHANLRFTQMALANKEQELIDINARLDTYEKQIQEAKAAAIKAAAKLGNIEKTLESRQKELKDLGSSQKTLQPTKAHPR
jgi:sigma-B regulation protein RsbU (phosphoserine phosphatase)